MTVLTAPQLKLFESFDLGPPLKWAGGKRWLLPYLRPVWENHNYRRLVEPLCGGMAVSLGLVPERALLNDINKHVIYFYRWLQKGFVIESELVNKSDAYYNKRKRFNQLVHKGESDSKEASEIFYYLNRTGYNGLCRFNRKGEFNVPFGSYKRINYVYEFLEYQDLFSYWQFESASFMDLEIEDDDFIYADPPYDVDFRQYSRHGFEWTDQIQLAEWLADHPGPVVLSNQATSRIVKLYKRLGYELIFLAGPRRISCNGDRTPAKEVLAVKNI